MNGGDNLNRCGIPARHAAGLLALGLAMTVTACQLSQATAQALGGSKPAQFPATTCNPNPVKPSKLLFLSNRPGGAADSNYDLYSADLAGESVTRVTDFPDYSIRWFDRDHHTGRIVLALSSGGDLTIGPSGRHGAAHGGEQAIAILDPSAELQFLVDIRPGGPNPEGFVGVWHPTFSPGGERVVYSGTKSGESANLWIINTDRSGSRRLISDPQRTHQDPRFAPNGRVVYIRHNRQGFQQLTDPNGLNVWIVDPDDPGSNRPITDEARIPGSPRIETDPAMSPDCRWVASIRATEPFGLRTLLRPASDNVLFPTGVATEQAPIRALQTGANPLRVHGVPTWLDTETLLSYRWESLARGWRIIRYRVDDRDGDVSVLDLESQAGFEDLMPLAY